MENSIVNLMDEVKRIKPYRGRIIILATIEIVSFERLKSKYNLAIDKTQSLQVIEIFFKIS